MTISRTRTAALASLPLAVLTGFVAATPSGDDAVARPLVLVSGTGGAGDSGNGKNKGSGNEGKVVTLSGSTDGLFPGSVRPLVVTAQNNNNFAMRLDAVAATVGSPVYMPGSRPAGDCTSKMATVGPFTVGAGLPAVGSTLVANGPTPLSTTVRLSPDAVDACKTAVFPLTYTATASKK